MLKPNENWTWNFDNDNQMLTLDTGSHSIFNVKLAKRLLVNSAFEENQFSVDDAKCYQTIIEQALELGLPESRLFELAVNGAAAHRFHKPVQPKSWFFNPQGGEFTPEEGEIVHLSNNFNDGYFMVIETGSTASICISLSLDEFQLTDCKQMFFGEPIKVMHDRFAKVSFCTQSYALVG